MSKIVNNKFVEASLNASNLSLSINLLSCIDESSLEQIHKILIFCQEHSEIQAIYLDLSNIPCEKKCEQTKEQVDQANRKIQSISLLLLNLTQTVVVDYGDKVNHQNLELGLCADLKIAHEDVLLSFDYLENGLIPGAGGISMLEKLLSPIIVKNWIFGNKKISCDQLMDKGFIYENYNNDSKEKVVENLLFHLKSLPPVQRVQSKRSFWEKWSNNWEQILGQETLISKAALLTNDHQEAGKENPNYCKIKDLKSLLSQSEKVQ